VVSVAIVGGGFGGVGAAALLKRAGYTDVTVFERSERIGGVWNDNTYPGAACDVPSHLYEYSFAPNPNWSRRYAPQAEIQAYLEQVATAEGVSDRIRTGVEVRSAEWNEDKRKWHLETSSGSGDFDLLITACGQLSIPKVPALKGRSRFKGPAFHTARWPRDLDLAGKRVAVIGTGASAIQAVPAIASEVSQLDVYQRSPGWTLPRGDHRYSRVLQRLFAVAPALQRADRKFTFAALETMTLALTSQPWMRKGFEAVGRWQIRRGIDDQELRELVTPSDEIFCKRIMLTDAWYPTLARDNVSVITQPIKKLTPEGILLGDGEERPTDVIVYATGFESHAFIAPMQISGISGRTLEEAWGGVPRAYYGLSVPEFPNMFMLYGPNTNSGSGSVIFTIESGVQHVIAALREMQRQGAHTIEVRRGAAEAFNAELQAVLRTSVWHTGCTNWYVDADGNDPSQWPWLWSRYRRKTANLIPGAYRIA
jgi:cation diffusion facilitator CzcD-associated flavoprotein CzcO